MIEKFNFYDIYGNLFPGMALISLIWIPMGLVSGFWPGHELSSALVSLVLSYFVGHLIQILAGSVVPADVELASGSRRFPSDFILDSEDSMLTAELKEKLAAAVKKSPIGFDLHVTKSSEEITKEISALRNDAFRQARATLLRSDSKSYAQQFEGLYAMMRGLAVAFWLGCFYFFGWSVSYLVSYLLGLWAASPQQSTTLQWMAGVLPAVALLAGTGLTLLSNSLDVSRGEQARENRKKKVRLERWIGGLLTLVALASGALVAWSETFTSAMAIACALFALGALFCAFRCYGAYVFFTKEFARAVWSDFLNLEVGAEKSSEKPLARRQAAGKK